MKQSMAATSTKNAHSLETSASVEEFSSKSRFEGSVGSSLRPTVHTTSWSVFLFALVFINNCLILGVSCFQLRWTELLFSAVITSITLRSTTDLRSAIRLSLPTYPLHSVSSKVTSWLLVNADPSPRQCASTWSARKSSVLKVTSRKHSSSSEEWAADIL